MEYVWFGVIGLALGALAGQVLRGQYNIFADMVIGVLGALAGSHLFLTYLESWSAGPVGGYVFAVIGAGIFLLAWRALRSVN